MFRFSHPALSNTTRRLVAGLVTGLAVLSLASCGGGTQSKKFVPESLVVFGDELSLITGQGAKYAINSYVSGSAAPYSCNTHVLWAEYFAYYVNFKFTNECPDWTGGGNLTATMRANDPVDVSINATSAATAVANAGANAVLTTVNNNLGLLNDKTLVTVSVGRADIVKAYLTYLLTPDDATLSSQTSQLKTLGGNFAAGWAPVVRSGARSMVLLTPDLGVSPLAKADATNLTRNKAALAALSKAFNDGLELGLSINGYTGQQVSLVRIDSIVRVIEANPATYSLTNVDNAACATPASSAPLCMDDVASLVSSDAASTYMWADATHLNTLVHGTIASLVYSAYTRNPF